MGAFCVFGISKSVCRDRVSKKLSSDWDVDLKRTPTIEEWAAKRDRLAGERYDEREKREKISPEFDAPQFCADWIAINPAHVRMTAIMVRGPKTDSATGKPLLRNGAPVMTWLEYSAKTKSAIPAVAKPKAKAKRKTAKA